MEISEKKALEKHISKQMKVYKQITFFHKKSKLLKICFPDRKMDFLRGGPIFGEKKTGTGTRTNRNRYELEPVEPNRGFKDLGVNRTEPNRGLTV